jgi:hypothetical protein
MNALKRYHNRGEIRDEEVDPEREAELLEAYQLAEYGEFIGDCVAATFEPDTLIDSPGVVVSSRLSRDRMFCMVSAFSGGDEDVDVNTRKASATVRDIQTDEKLAAHVSADRVLIALRSEDTSFQSFRDYVLFLEESLGVGLSPVLP